MLPFPLSYVGPLRRPVAPLGNEHIAHRLGGISLGGHDVISGFGEILDPARVVEIEMGENDVPHITDRKAGSLNLMQCGLAQAEADVGQAAHEFAQARVRLGRSRSTERRKVYPRALPD